MRKILFDSHAILKYSQDEPGADEVEKLLNLCQHDQAESIISQINLGEVYYKTIRRKGLEFARNYLQNFAQLPIKVIPASEEIVLLAAEIKARYPISYADCFAAATAIQAKAAIITGDPEFRKVEEIVKIHWV